MVFRSLAISSSLLALLASGSVMAMEDNGNDVSSSSLKRNEKQANLPQANKKKERRSSATDMQQTYSLTKESNEKLKKAAREGDKKARDEMIRRFEHHLIKLNRDEDLKDFLSWKNIEKHIVKKQGYASILYHFYNETEVMQFLVKIEEAAQAGLPNAQLALGRILKRGMKDKNGQVTIKSAPLKAMEWFKKAAQAGLLEARSEIGCLLEYGEKDENGQEVIDKNPVKSMEWYEAAARDGLPSAQWHMGWILHHGIRVHQKEVLKKDPLKAMEWYEAAALNGHQSAQVRLGKILLDGVRDENGQVIIKRDPLKAKEWFEKAAQDWEDLDAQLKLGKILLDGVRDEYGQVIIKRDPLKAMEWFEKAAQCDTGNDDGRGQFKLGKLLLTGVEENGQVIIKRDPIKAIKWLEEAKEYGNWKAEFELAEMAFRGVSDENGQVIIKRDPLKAKELLKEASTDENPYALFKLGKIRWDGLKDETGKEIIKRNPQKAKKWFKDSAILSENPDAQFELGKIRRDGVRDEAGQQIIKRDLEKAMKWFEKAAKQGHQEAKVQVQQVQLQRRADPAVVQKATPDARSTWKFDPTELRNATEGELKLYDEIMGKLEESSLSNIEKQRAKNALLRFRALHANNVEICRELMETPEVRSNSAKVYAVTLGDILIHPEQGDANLEQRAHIIYNILETTYAGVKGNPISLEKFFKEAFTDTIPCLEAQSVKIDEWRASQESIEIKINRQSIAQNIGEHANQLLENMRKNSKVGKKLIEAQQDYQNFSERLQKIPNVSVGQPQYQQIKGTKEFFETALKHISQSIKTFEKKHEKWLKENNKYAEMHQNLLTALVGKIAQDGEITENAINDMLSSGLGWDIPPQE